ncbi:MAG: GIY-YIG nuclease family protein [Caldisphaera sp.]|nr:DUF123 domain-containing protein [Caldisphaera sp.]
MCPEGVKSDDDLWGIGAFSLQNSLPNDKGLYIIGFQIVNRIKFNINKKLYKLDNGFVIYVGSAGNGLRDRLKRHLLKNKRIKWHIDYLSSSIDSLPIFIFYVKGNYGVIKEDNLASLLKKSFTNIGMLGSTDSKEPHLFYSDNEQKILEFLLKTMENTEGSEMFIMPTFYNKKLSISFI